MRYVVCQMLWFLSLAMSFVFILAYPLDFLLSLSHSLFLRCEYICIHSLSFVAFNFSPPSSRSNWWYSEHDTSTTERHTHTQNEQKNSGISILWTNYAVSKYLCYCCFSVIFERSGVSRFDLVSNVNIVVTKLVLLLFIVSHWIFGFGLKIFAHCFNLMIILVTLDKCALLPFTLSMCIFGCMYACEHNSHLSKWTATIKFHSEKLVDLKSSGTNRAKHEGCCSVKKKRMNKKISC